jgi:RNA-directed DNA polymerase
VDESGVRRRANVRSTASRLLDQGQTMRWPRVARQGCTRHKRLDRAAQRGEYRTVHRVQKRRRRAHGAKRFAARQVTQDHRGKKPPGGDGLAALTPPARLALVAHLQRDGAAAPVPRVDMPNPGMREPRPFGLPLMGDRVQQRLVTQALEAAWAARVAPQSAGVRPGRKTWDAIGALSVQINQQPTWGLAADMAQGCERMAHDAL